MRSVESVFDWGERTYVMGVVNVTPDSFSGDGTIYDDSQERWVQTAVHQALRMEDEGADVIDIGGESTRPPSVYEGAQPVRAEVECARVLPVIEALAGRLDAAISIDTRKATVAQSAVRAGAGIINDVSMLGDTEMAKVAAESGAMLVISHTRPKAVYRDPVGDVAADLSAAVKQASDAGVTRGKIVVDPGIGFAKTPVHSLAVLRGLRSIKDQLGLPMLVGTSRKSFIGAVLDVPVDKRLEGTAATMALAVASGADVVRVHDVLAMKSVVQMSDAIVRGWEPDSVS